MSLISCVLAHKENDVLEAIVNKLTIINQYNFNDLLNIREGDGFYFSITLNLSVDENLVLNEILLSDWMKNGLKVHKFPMSHFDYNKIMNEVSGYFQINK